MEFTHTPKSFQEYLDEASGAWDTYVTKSVTNNTVNLSTMETCHSCGKKVVRTYQKNFCKPCLVKIFQRLQPVINSVSSICNKSPMARLGL